MRKGNKIVASKLIERRWPLVSVSLDFLIGESRVRRAQILDGQMDRGTENDWEMAFVISTWSNMMSSSSILRLPGQSTYSPMIV